MVLARVTHNTRKYYLWRTRHFPLTPLRASQRSLAALAMLARTRYSSNGIAKGTILITLHSNASRGSREERTGAVRPARLKSIHAPLADKFDLVQISNHSRDSRAFLYHVTTTIACIRRASKHASTTRLACSLPGYLVYIKFWHSQSTLLPPSLQCNQAINVVVTRWLVASGMVRSLGLQYRQMKSFSH